MSSKVISEFIYTLTRIAHTSLKSLTFKTTKNNDKHGTVDGNLHI